MNFIFFFLDFAIMRLQLSNPQTYLSNIACYLSFADFHNLLTSCSNLSKYIDYYQKTCRDFFNQFWNAVPNLNQDLERILSVAEQETRNIVGRNRSHYQYGFRECMRQACWLIDRLNPDDIEKTIKEHLYRLLNIIQNDTIESSYKYGLQAIREAIIKSQKMTKLKIVSVHDNKENILPNNEVPNDITNYSPISNNIWNRIYEEQQTRDNHYRYRFRTIINKLGEVFQQKYEEEK